MLSTRMLIFAALATWPLFGQEAPPVPKDFPGIAWERDFDAALERAEAENRPLMIAFVLAGEKANEKVMKEHFRDPKIIALSRRFVCLVASPNIEEDAPGPRVDGTTGPVNKKLGSATTKEIRKIEQRARADILEAQTVSCPQFVFLAPDAKTILLRHVWLLPAAALLTKMETAWGIHKPEDATDAAKKAREQVTELLKRALDTDPAVRRPAFEGLAAFDDPRVETFFRERTASTVPALQRTEAIFFGMRGEDRVRFLPRLLELLRDREAEVRVHSAVALGALRMVDALDPLTKALKREKQDVVRVQLLRAIDACTDDRKAFRKLIGKAAKSRFTGETAVAVWLAGQAEAGKDTDRIIGKAISHREGQVRFAAFTAAGQSGRQLFMKFLRQREKRESERLLLGVRWAIGELGGAPYDDDLDPPSVVGRVIPRDYLWQGQFTDPWGDGDGRAGRGGRGGAGGGRGGGGGGGGRGGGRGR